MHDRSDTRHSFTHPFMTSNEELKTSNKEKKGPDQLYSYPDNLFQKFSNLVILEKYLDDNKGYTKMSNKQKHQYANALWTVANSPNKFTEDKYSERFNAAQLRFSSFTRPIHSPLNAWLATAKVTKLKISPDGASPNGVSPNGASPDGVSPDGGVVQSPELKSTENFLDWIGAEKDGIIALFSGTRGAEFQKIMSGLWNTTPVRDADARFQQSEMSYVYDIRRGALSSYFFNFLIENDKCVFQ